MDEVVTSNVVDLVVLDEQNSLANRIKQWLAMMSPGLSLNTQRRYKDALERFQLFTQHEPVTQDLWVRYQQHLVDRELEAAYIHKECGIINQFFKWCELNKFVTVNPCRFSIKIPPVVTKKMQTFTHDQYEKMKEVSSGKTVEFWLVVASYATGASLCDVCLLKWDMVDMADLVINFVRRKTKRFQTPATIPFNHGDDLHKCLTLLSEEIGNAGPWPGSQYVCPDLAGRYLQGQTNPTMMMSRIIKCAGISGEVSHKTFRWTFISNWANSGASTALGCQVVGTKNPAIFTRYVNPDVGSMRDAIRESLERARERCGRPKTAMVPC